MPLTIACTNYVVVHATCTCMYVLIDWLSSANVMFWTIRTVELYPALWNLQCCTVRVHVGTVLYINIVYQSKRSRYMYITECIMIHSFVCDLLTGQQRQSGYSNIKTRGTNDRLRSECSLYAIIHVCAVHLPLLIKRIYVSCLLHVHANFMH